MHLREVQHDLLSNVTLHFYPLFINTLAGIVNGYLIAPDGACPEMIASTPQIANFLTMPSQKSASVEGQLRCQSVSFSFQSC